VERGGFRGTLMERDDLGDSGVDGILRLIFREWDNV